MGCACGMEPGLMDKAWHAAHLERHLEIYPDADEQTRAVLRECVENAKARGSQ